MIARLLFIEDIPPQQESTFFFFLGYLRHDHQVEVESEFLSARKVTIERPKYPWVAIFLIAGRNIGRISCFRVKISGLPANHFVY